MLTCYYYMKKKKMKKKYESFYTIVLCEPKFGYSSTNKCLKMGKGKYSIPYKCFFFLLEC